MDVEVDDFVKTNGAFSRYGNDEAIFRMSELMKKSTVDVCTWLAVITGLVAA